MAKVRGVYEFPVGSGVYYCQYFHEGHRFRERAGTKTDAGKLYRKRKTEILLGAKLPELRRKKVTLGELCDDALAYAREHNQRSLRDYVTKARLVKEGLGSRGAEDLRPDEISDWIKGREVTAATFNRYRAFFSLCYREGMRIGKVGVNPARRVRQKQEPRGRSRFLSREEYARIYENLATQNEREEFETSIFTGMRLTEQFTVTWGQFDYDRSLIALSKTKNGDDRTVVLNTQLRDLLRDRKERMEGRRSDLIFPGNTKGGRVDTRTWFGPALKAAKVEDYTWHGNRHTFCSWLALAGVPLKTIQVLAGHKTIAITARYAHLAPEHTASEVERLLVAPVYGKVLAFKTA